MSRRDRIDPIPLNDQQLVQGFRVFCVRFFCLSVRAAPNEIITAARVKISATEKQQSNHGKDVLVFPSHIQIR